MIEWLSENATWLGAVGAIAAIVALFRSLLSRKRSTKDSPVSVSVTASGGSVATGGNITNSTLSVGSARPSPSESSTKPEAHRTRVLLVFANPKGSSPLRLQEENRALLESIQLSKHRSCIECEPLPAATIDDLRRALLNGRYDIVHFSGHGTDKGLIFEDTEGSQMVLSSKSLADLLIRHKVGTAVFNACHSLSVGSLASTGLDYTIASTDEIQDPAAVEFARGFYDAIGAVDAWPSDISAWNQLGNLYLRTGQLDEATEMFRRVGELASSTDRPKKWMAIRYGNLGIVHRIRGELDQAIQMHEKSLTIETELGRKEGMASQYGHLGIVHLIRGEIDQGAQMLEKSLAINTELGHKEGMANQYGNLGNMHQIRGDLDQAIQMCCSSL